MKQLICDSGGTKSAWLLIEGGLDLSEFTTDGINPAVNSHEHIMDVLAAVPQTLGALADDVNHVWFYGAGCVRGAIDEMREAINAVLPSAEVNVESDMLGAARALCQRSEGIACILGTGANSCYYDGEKIRQNTPALGYILGDEGGGAVLGRTLINHIYKGVIPETMRKTFEDEMNTDIGTIIEHVYRRPQANKYLASFTHFLSAHRDNEQIHKMLLECFGQFFSKNIDPYGRRDLPVNFIGSLAYHFRAELIEAAHAKGYRLGVIVQSPLAGLALYHRTIER